MGKKGKGKFGFRGNLTEFQHSVECMVVANDPTVKVNKDFLTIILDFLIMFLIRADLIIQLQVNVSNRNSLNVIRIDIV